MKQRIRLPDDLVWLLNHTGRFQGGRVTDLHVHKKRVYDEGSGREVMAGTVLTAVIRYEAPCLDPQGLYAVARVAKLTMYGVTDFSIFEQEGSDCSEIGVIHAEATGGRLRFWFDPQGELYVICAEAELEEVSMPATARPIPYGLTEWTFQADRGDLPGVSWFLEHLDRAGVPCAWRAARKPAPAHPAWRWEGELLSAGSDRGPQGGLVHVHTYGPLDGCGFGVTLRTCDPYEAEAVRLLLVLAEIITRHYEGTCLAGRQVWAGDEWCGALGPASVQREELSSGRKEGLS